MSRGLLLMVLAGIGFLYLVIDLVNEAESTTPGLENTQSNKTKEYAMFYKKDINGDDMLIFSNVSLDKAKKVWKESSINYRMLSYFPDFDAMKEIINGQLDESKFKAYLLKQLDILEGDYLDGKKNLDQTKEALKNLK